MSSTLFIFLFVSLVMIFEVSSEVYLVETEDGTITKMGEDYVKGMPISLVNSYITCILTAWFSALIE